MVKIKKLINKLKSKLYIRDLEEEIIESYDMYYFKSFQFLKYLLTGLGICTIIGYLFYKSWIAIVLLSPFCIFYIIQKRKELIISRKNQLLMEFKEAITAVSAALNAGYSLENSFREATRDIKMLLLSNSIIIKELEYITNQLYLNKTIESLLEEFSNRCNIEDISNFTEVLITAKRSGGDMVKIIGSTSKNISEKIEIKKEISILIASKKYELKIMNLIPFLIIIYLNLTSPNFLNGLYHNSLGILVMTVCLMVYSFAYYLSNKIVDIKV